MLASSHLWVLLCLICGFLGCWQEIQYTPNPSNQGNSDVAGASSTRVASAEQPTASVEILPTPSAEPSEPMVQPESTAEASANSVIPTEPVATEFDAEVAPVDQDELIEPSAEDSPYEAPTPVADSARDLLAAWKMSSEWSMAVALQAKGIPAERCDKHFQLASEAAQQLGVKLPALPEHAEDADRLEANVQFLLEEAGPRLASAMTANHGEQHAALVELATKSHLMLLSYVPDSERLDPVVAAIERSARNSGLPDSVWAELVNLLASRASFQEIKSAVFGLHKSAATHLSELSVQQSAP